MRQGDQFQASFLFCKKTLNEARKWPAAQCQHNLITLNLAKNKNKLYKTTDYIQRYAQW